MEVYNIKISEYSSLEFDPEWKHDFETDECYMQSFASSDNMRVQFSMSKDYTPSVILEEKYNTAVNIPTIQIAENEDVYVYTFSITGLATGCYKVRIKNNEKGFSVASYFQIQPSCYLHHTTLLRYTNRENMFDVVFLNENEENYYFELRVPGGFQYRDISFNVSDETFRDQRYTLSQLSAFPYETNPLTIGTKEGVPIWVGRKINLIFSLSAVTVDDTEYIRSEGAEVEMTQLGTYYPLYVFTISLEPTEFYSTTYSRIPVLGTEDYRIMITEDRQNMILI